MLKNGWDVKQAFTQDRGPGLWIAITPKGKVIYPFVTEERAIHYAENGAGQKVDPLDTQVGGSHYKGLAIQPGIFCELNRLTLFEGNVVKRICRWRLPGGEGIEDLRKSQHETELIIQTKERREELLAQYRSMAKELEDGRPGKEGCVAITAKKRDRLKRR
jgi:hypothetical protein